MPKRVGFLYEQFISKANCILAEVNMARNKPDNDMAKHIGANAEKYGKLLSKLLSDDVWVASPNRELTIVDSYKGKTRHLKVPCLLDQSVQYAWLNIATPYIERHNYFYNCGSIPNAGQSRAVEGLQKWLGTKKSFKFGGIADITKFYETCPHWAVIKGLKRLFKDKKFIRFAELILKSMSPTDVGLAIGHPSSHWFANIALMELDHMMTQLFPDVKHTRYMDDVAMLSNNKRHLRKAMYWWAENIGKLGMKIKHTWQVFQIKLRGITFLAYRFFKGFTMLTKRLLYRMTRKIRKAAVNLTVHGAAGILSYMGILKHCNSYHIRERFVYPLISIKKCKEVVSNAAKNNVRCAA